MPDSPALLFLCVLEPHSCDHAGQYQVYQIAHAWQSTEPGDKHQSAHEQPQPCDLSTLSTCVVAGGAVVVPTEVRLINQEFCVAKECRLPVEHVVVQIAAIIIAEMIICKASGRRYLPNELSQNVYQLVSPHLCASQS